MTELMQYAILLLLCGIFYIATSSIGLQCNSNQTQEYQDQHKSSYYFLIISVVMAVIMILIACYAIFLAYTNSTVPESIAKVVPETVLNKFEIAPPQMPVINFERPTPRPSVIDIY